MHPQVTGRVVDAVSTEPIGGAVIQFVDSEYGGGETRSADDGSYDLPAVSARFSALLTGDVRFRSTIECSAPGYNAKRIPWNHGPSGAYGNHDVLRIDFGLIPIGDPAGRSEEDNGTRGR